jgi:hypothetical protein
VSQTPREIAVKQRIERSGGTPDVPERAQPPEG